MDGIDPKVFASRLQEGTAHERRLEWSVAADLYGQLLADLSPVAAEDARGRRLRALALLRRASALLQLARWDEARGALDDALDVEVRITRHDGYGYEMHGRELAPKMALGRVQVGLRALTHEGLALAATTWPPLYAAAAAGALATAAVETLGTYGVWEEWWIGTLWFALFLVLVMGRSGESEAPRSRAAAISR